MIMPYGLGCENKWGQSVQKILVQRAQQKMAEIFSLPKYCQVLEQDPLPRQQMYGLLLGAYENVHFVMEVLTHNYLMLSQVSHPNIRKYNTLLTISLMLDSANSVIINLMEAYLLDVLFKYALNIHDQPPNTNFRVFQLGRQNNGWNRQVLLAIDIIVLAAQIKPYQIFQTYEIQSPSSFSRALDILYAKLDPTKVQRIQNNKLEAEEKKAFLRKKFLKNIHEFHRDHSHYVHYFVEKTTMIIKGMCDKHDHMNILNLLKDNRGYLNSEVLGLAVEFLEKGLKTEHKIMALFIINHLVIHADIEVIMMMNYSDVFESMAEKIEKKNTKQDISQSEAKLTMDFLRNIRLWSLCMPFDNFLHGENNQPSLVMKIYNRLSQNPCIKFPNNPFELDILRQYQHNWKQKEERNKKIIQQLYLYNYVTESESGIVSENSDIFRLKNKIVTINKLLLFENVSESGIDAYMKKIKHEQAEMGRMLEEMDDDSLELEAEEYLQRVNGLIKVYNDNRNHKTRYEKVVNHLKKMGIKVPKQVVKSLENKKNFFDSSSQESINSIKSWIYHKYARKPQQNIRKGQRNNFEVNYKALIDDDGGIQVPKLQPLLNSHHISQEQRLKVRVNPTFKQCSDIKESLIPFTDRQHQMATHVMNEQFKINSPPHRTRANSKTKMTEQSSRSKLESQQLSVLKTYNWENKNYQQPASTRKPFLKQPPPEQEFQSLQLDSLKKKLSNMKSSSNKFAAEMCGSGEVIKLEDIKKQCIQDYDEKTKKKLLKNKIRVLKNDQLEIGTKVEREGSSLRITYFITPYINISRFHCTVERIPELDIKLFPLHEDKLSADEQYQVHILVEMVMFVYRLPFVKFAYAWMEENCWVQSDEFESLLPALSIKFVQHREIRNSYIQQQFLLQSSLRTREIKIARSILKDKLSIHKYIPNLVLLDENSNSEVIYGTYCIYKKCHFIIKIIIKNQDVIWAEGVGFPSDDEVQCQAILHHYLCMINKLFSITPL